MLKTNQNVQLEMKPSSAPLAPAPSSSNPGRPESQTAPGDGQPPVQTGTAARSARFLQAKPACEGQCSNDVIARHSTRPPLSSSYQKSIKTVAQCMRTTPQSFQGSMRLLRESQRHVSHRQRCPRVANTESPRYAASRPLNPCAKAAPKCKATAKA